MLLLLAAPLVVFDTLTSGASLKPYALLPRMMIGLKSAGIAPAAGAGTGGSVLVSATDTFEFCASSGDVVTPVMVRHWQATLPGVSFSTGSRSFAGGPNRPAR